MLYGSEFKKGSSDFDLYIDGKQIKYSRYYTFSTFGQHEVKLILYQNLNMDYMFKDAKDLISIKMKSNDDKCKITSMISTFENCQNLQSFDLAGFNFESIKSMKKIFYKTSLKQFKTTKLNTYNLEDISYMFANSPIETVSFENIIINNVKDMSHFFE